MGAQDKRQGDLFGANVAIRSDPSETVASEPKPAALRANETFLTVGQVAKRYSVSNSTIWRWVHSREGFPDPYEIAKGTTRWASSDLNAFERSLRRKRSRDSGPLVPEKGRH